METYRYVNIFETKGLEYLLLISFLVLFVLLIRYLRRPEDTGEATAPTHGGPPNRKNR